MMQIINIAIGGLAMGAGDVSGGDNISIGRSTMCAATSASENISIGATSMRAKQSGADSIAIGRGALGTAAAGAENIAMGTGAMGGSLVTGAKNIGIGKNVIDALTSGACNIALGMDASGSLTTGCVNIAIGCNTAAGMTTGCENIAIGVISGGATTAATGTRNVAIGTSAQNQLCGGNDNVSIGYYTHSQQYMAGHCNVAVGAQASFGTSDGTFNIGLGFGAGGNGSGGRHKNINIGCCRNKTGDCETCIMGCVYMSGGYTTSDCRAKRCISDSDLGLAFINAIRPVKYKWKIPRDLSVDPITGDLQIGSADEEGQRKSKQFEYGIIAQEVEQVLENMGKDYTEFAGINDREADQGKIIGTYDQEYAEPDKYWYPGCDDYDPDHPDYQVASASQGGEGYIKIKTAQYDQFIAPIMTAVQELDAKVVALTTRVTTLED